MKTDQIRLIVAEIHALLDRLVCLHAGQDPVRPPVPSRAWCMVPPGTVRWDGEITLSPAPWSLLNALLTLGPDGNAVSIIDLEEATGRELNSGSFRSCLYRLNVVLEQIGFPWYYGVRAGYVVRH